MGSLSLFLKMGYFSAYVVRGHTTASQYKDTKYANNKALKVLYVSVALHWCAVDSLTLIGWSGDHVMKKREGKMAGPCFSRLEAFFEDYFHRKKKVSGAHKGGAWLWRTWKGIGEEKRVPLGVRTVVLGLFNGEQGTPMGGAPHVYSRRVRM